MLQDVRRKLSRVSGVSLACREDVSVTRMLRGNCEETAAEEFNLYSAPL